MSKVWARKLRELREMHPGLTRKKVEADTGIGERTLGHWERGEREVSLDALGRLAAYYGVPTDYILGRETSEDKQWALLDLVRVPVIENFIVAVGDSLPRAARLLIERCEGFMLVPRALVQPESFLLQVPDSSMSPDIQESDYAIVSPTQNWEDGDICALYIKNALTIRKLMVTEDGIMLVPFNFYQYKPIIIASENFKADKIIVGRVTGLWRRYPR